MAKSLSRGCEAVSALAVGVFGENAAPGQWPVELLRHHRRHVRLKVAEHREPPHPGKVIVWPMDLETKKDTQINLLKNNFSTN